MNSQPILTKDTATTDEDTTVIISPLVNDSDADKDTLTITKATAPNGIVVINNDGTLTYTPKANYYGLDTITYTVSDGNGGIVSSSIAVTVNSINDNPIANADIAKTNEDTAVIIKPLINDIDADKNKLIITEATASNGTVIINSNGTLKYIPNANYHGVDTIDYTISDGNGGIVSSTVTVTVNSINDKPILTKDTATTDEDTTVIISPLVNDSDADKDTLTITKATAPNGIVVINNDGTLTYTPKANYYGLDTITYTVSDGNGGIVSSSIAVTVNEANEEPIINYRIDKVIINDNYFVDYTYDDNDNVISALNITPYDNFINNFEYDANGNIKVLEIDINFDGIADDAHTYTTDDNGKFLTLHIDDDNDGVIDDTYEYFYDAKGNVSYTEEKHNINDQDYYFTAQDKYTYEYDSFERIIKIQDDDYIDSDLNSSSIREFTYDDDGNILTQKITEISYTHHESDSVDLMTYFYNEEGNVDKVILDEGNNATVDLTLTFVYELGSMSEKYATFFTDPYVIL